MGSAVTVSKDVDVAILQVTGGVHRGVAAPIGERAIRIGAGGGADIVLSDAGVADDHALLRFERGSVTVEARGADVGMGRHVIPRGQGCRARLPVDISIGGCAMRLDRPDGRAGWLDWRTMSIGAVALVVALAAATQADAIKAVATDGGAPTAAEVEAKTPPAVDLAARAPTGDPVAALSQRVAEAKIDGIRIEADGDRIVARGLLDEPARKRWAATQKWFDESFSGRFVLASEVGAKSAATMPRFQVQAIWFGATPYVVTADGQRRHPGATLGDGWVIRDIRDGRLTVAKAGEEVSLNF